jgi:hypothetical protein
METSTGSNRAGAEITDHTLNQIIQKITVPNSSNHSTVVDQVKRALDQSPLKIRTTTPVRTDSLLASPARFSLLFLDFFCYHLLSNCFSGSYPQFSRAGVPFLNLLAGLVSVLFSRGVA